MTFSGLNQNLTPRPHQANAAWRGIIEGTVLLDHVVGSGKTLTTIITIMESKRLGLISKPIIVVPNHLVNQWAAEFYEAYPNASLLTATKKDFTPKMREQFFSRIATGNWDAVIVAHSQFERIPMPVETEKQFLDDMVWELRMAIEQLDREEGTRRSIKQMEKKIEALEARIERIMKAKHKKSPVDFETIGINFMAVDEADLFKNLFYTTSQRVAGLGNTDGSQRAFDMLIKCRHIQSLNDDAGRGVLFATGTPISNSVAEMFTLQRYLQWDLLHSKGMVHFDSWANSFGEIITGWELDSTGVNYKLNSRFASFTNVPELLSYYMLFADSVHADDFKRMMKEAGMEYPVPELEGGKHEIVIAERSTDQKIFMDEIIERAENLPSNPKIDNMLKITNDARKAGLDYRLIDPDAPDFEGTKINKMIQNIVDIYHQWNEHKGTQIVFCDLSTPKSTKGAMNAIFDAANDDELSMDEVLSSMTEFSVYEDIKVKLIRLGIPANEIEFIHNANTDLQKEVLFVKVNKGVIRVLLGSTFKLGAGTNVQERLVALHHLDCGWRPRDSEQRDGRILRQGNKLFEALSGFKVRIIRYVTERTYDACMWQVVEQKARFINQIRKGVVSGRTIEDIGGDVASYAEIKAAATGNPFILEQVRLDGEKRKLESLKHQHTRQIIRLKDRISRTVGYEETAKENIKNLYRSIEIRNANPKEGALPIIDGVVYEEREDMLDAIEAKINEFRAFIKIEGRKGIAVYRGFEFALNKSYSKGTTLVLHTPFGELHSEYESQKQINSGGMLTRINNMLDKLEHEIKKREIRLISDSKDHKDAVQGVDKPFPKQEELDKVTRQYKAVMAELELMKGNDYVARTVEEVLGEPIDIMEPIVEEISTTGSSSNDEIADLLWDAPIEKSEHKKAALFG